MRGYLERFRLSIEQWAPNGRIVYDKFHTLCNTPTKPSMKCAARSFPQGRASLDRLWWYRYEGAMLTTSGIGSINSPCSGSSFFRG